MFTAAQLRGIAEGLVRIVDSLDVAKVEVFASYAPSTGEAREVRLKEPVQNTGA